MSSRRDVKKWMNFCQHMREAIIDEQKAVPDYEKLRHEARELIELMSKSKIQDMSFLHTVHSEVGSIISDEERHAEILMPLFERVCPRMAVSRKGIRRKRESDIEITDEDSMIQADYNRRHRHTFTD